MPSPQLIVAVKFQLDDGIGIPRIAERDAVQGEGRAPAAIVWFGSTVTVGLSWGPTDRSHA